MVISGPSNRERRTVKRILMATLLLGLMGPAACGSLWPGQEQPENAIKLAGHIETTETDLGFQVPGRIDVGLGGTGRRSQGRPGGGQAR